MRRRGALGAFAGFTAAWAWLSLALAAAPAPTAAPPPPAGVAVQEEQTSNPHQLMFVPPPVEGAVSLGVYNAQGKLVRVLAKAAPVESFKAGLNGLIVDWDGNDAAGKPVPTGKYYARGVVAGEEVDISGEAFYFNDFADNTSSPRPSRVIDAALYPGERAAVLAVAGSNPEVLIADAKGSEPQHVPVDVTGEAHLKPAGMNLLLLDRDRVQQVDPKTRKVLWEEKGSGLRDADSDGKKALFLWDRELVLLTDKARQPLQLPVPDVMYAVLLQSKVLLGTAGGKLWTVSPSGAVALEISDPKPLLGLAAGRGDSAWLLVREGDQALVRQLDVSSRQVHDLELPPDLRGAGRISAARNQDALLFFIKTPDSERVVGLHYQNANAQQSIWEKWFDRSRRNFAGFDLKNGKVLPGNDQDASPLVTVQAADNPLENSRQPVFELGVYADESGTWLVGGDGLPICQVSKTKDVKQVKWLSDGQNGVRVFVSDGRVVEEYRVTGLDNLYRFDAGSFD